MIEKIKLKHGSSFRARITWIDGKPMTQTFRRKTDAESWKRKKLEERDQVRITGIVIQDSLTFGEFVEKWMKEKVEARLSPSTQAGYKSDLRLHILPHIKDVPLRSLRLEHGNQILLSLISKRRSPKTINGVLGLLQGIMNEAVLWSFAHRNPFGGLKPLKGEAEVDVYWTESEIEQFLRATLRTKRYPIWVVTLNTGMRRGEIGALQWDRVSFQRRQIEVTRTAGRFGLRENTKGGRKRIVPMNDAVYNVLWPLWKLQQGKFVFCEERGEPVDAHHIYRDFQIAQEKAGFTNLIRFHDLRHTFASQFMMKGGNIYDLQKILGHSTIGMTERYAHLSPTHLENAIQIVNFEGEKQNDSPKTVQNFG
ncbi:MAG: tyrosine-type recombinase/integrase, partial [Bdellovibrionota bacterium]